jgi:hypothetical protein
VLAIYNYMRERKKGFTVGKAELLFRKHFEESAGLGLDEEREEEKVPSAEEEEKRIQNGYYEDPWDSTGVDPSRQDTSGFSDEQMGRKHKTKKKER